MMRHAFLCIVLIALAALASDAPIRVGILKGTAPARYWHTSMHPGADAIAAMLANPAGASLNDPVIPPQGFLVRMFGPDSLQCSGNGCGPTTEQRAEFVSALDSLDVVIVLNYVTFGSNFTQVQRERMINHWSTKGMISLHQSNDNMGEWSDWLNISAVRMLSHPPQMQATLRLDTVNGAGQNADWKFLNHGLPDSARFHEEWLTFSRSSAELRAGGYSSELVEAGSYPPVVVTTNLDETTYEQTANPNQTMGGDHPMSWYRKFNTGGRFFYTALGHNTSTFDSVYFFRRQLYNAILWTAKYDSLSNVSITTAPSRAAFTETGRIALNGSAVTVAVLQDGPHDVELRSLDGRTVAKRRGTGRTEHRFEGLRAGVYSVAITTPQGRTYRVIAIP